MTQRMRNRLIELLTLFAIAGAAAFVMPRAHAEMIATDEAAQVQGERERVKALLERPEVAKRLGDLGVGPGGTPAREEPRTHPAVLQSVRARTSSSLAKNCCHPALAPPKACF